MQPLGEKQTFKTAKKVPIVFASGLND